MRQGLDGNNSLAKGQGARPCRVAVSSVMLLELFESLVGGLAWFGRILMTFNGLTWFDFCCMFIRALKNGLWHHQPAVLGSF